ncbi:hypothetical protein [Sporomusa sp.]|uniref:hypothetical protein n=1 Tax=Sporomusa sp. TaxID=2078658 RepID=UPI002D0DD279|nr:hypothetical protein [Sporomusa sp.]HWR45684.1 hypothetical protein [Sporomusa sp.]
MIFQNIKNQPRGQILARGIAIAGFTVLTVLAILKDNVVFAPLFFLLGAYYVKKLCKKNTADRVDATVASRPVLNPDAAQTELAKMLQYYKRLLKNWQWIAVFGWVLSVGLLIYAPSMVVMITLGLACYSTYALFRCRQAVHLIETSPAMRREGKQLKY